MEGDGELLRRLGSGDHSAFTALVHRWEDTLYRIACRITGDHAAAEDARQAVFLRLLERPRSIRHADRLGRWLRRSVVNEAINIVRKKRRMHPGGYRLERAVDSADPLQAREQSEQLREAMEKLDPGDRALLSLRFDEGLTMREISTVVRRPISTVKTRVDRAVGRLRSHLKRNNAR